ncbi:hypothetical protein GCM10010455_11440 [Microbacterium esteraromaticum]
MPRPHPPTLTVGLDELEFATQPACPECGVGMRTEPHAFVCPHCALLQLDGVEMPSEFDGRDIGHRGSRAGG